jgi:glycogen phosphorylase
MESLKTSYSRYLRDILSKDNTTATTYDKFMALAYAIRSEMLDRWIETQNRYHAVNVRRVYFLSTEHMFGRSLKQNILNMDMEAAVNETMAELGMSPEDLYEQEAPFDLGYGGKGRLSACLQDAMATLEVPATSYGLRYDFGVFRQTIEDGGQVEHPYDWLHKGHPWEIIRPEFECDVYFYGKTVRGYDPQNPRAVIWEPGENIKAVPFDFPVSGFRNRTVNTLRMWSSRASEEFLPDYAHHGDYIRACDEKSSSGTVTRILFPEMDVLRATEMRLKQHYFLVCASLHDIIRRYKQHNSDMSKLHEKVVIQLSGSSCGLAVPELMRILVDIEKMHWNDAWNITQNVFTYTSHAVTRGALETWPVYMMTQLLPRHMEIIYELNQRHLDDIRAHYSDDAELIRNISIIEEGAVQRVRLANITFLGARCINGVSVVQTKLLKTQVFSEFASCTSNRIKDITNGISHRRWLFNANRPLADLITDAIGSGWIKDSEQLALLEPFAHDAAFIEKFVHIRAQAKKNFSVYIKKKYGFECDAEAMFDVHCAKIHPYKRHVLHVFNILLTYLRIKNGEPVLQNRLHLFSGKAAPDDQLAKQIIRLIHAVAVGVNSDPAVSPRLKVLFLPDYDISLAERIVPIADITEHIATPGMEACGTSNFKFAINGAIPVVSRGGSNLEMIEKMGGDTLIVLDRTVDQLPPYGEYDPYTLISENPRLDVLFTFLREMLANVPHNGKSIHPLLSSLMDSDRYYNLLDFDDYIQKQLIVDSQYNDKASWNSRCIQTIARSGSFSIDHTVRHYAQDIWRV